METYCNKFQVVHNVLYAGCTVHWLYYNGITKNIDDGPTTNNNTVQGNGNTESVNEPRHWSR
jgi:hypothetical protein